MEKIDRQEVKNLILDTCLVWNTIRLPSRVAIGDMNLEFRRKVKIYSFDILAYK